MKICLFLADVVFKRVWKNLRNGMSKCLKRREVMSQSGADASRLPTRRLFEQLMFLKDILLNRLTESNVDLTESNDVDSSNTHNVSDNGSLSPSPMPGFSALDSLTPQPKKKNQVPRGNSQKKIIDRGDSIDCQ